MNMLKLAPKLVGAFFLIFSAMLFAAETTTIDYSNGESVIITTDQDGTTIENSSTRESTQESHSQAVSRLLAEANDKGEVAKVRNKFQ